MNPKKNSVLREVFFLSLPDDDHRRVRALGRSHKTSSAAVVRASVELALDEWEARGLPAKTITSHAK